MIEDLKQRLQKEEKIELIVRVRPHAPKTQITGVLADGSLKVDLAAPAEDNRANVALVRTLAEAFAVDSSCVKVLSGKTARIKLVRIVDDH